MKKLFTLVALLAMFLGANAQGGKWVEVYSIDYSTYNAFPFYVMGYVPEFDNGCLTDFGAMYGYLNDEDFAKGGDFTEVGMVGTYHKVQYTSPQWHQYFIADGIPTKIAGKYKVIANVKATAACTINVNMGWSWSEDPSSASVSIPEGTDFQEVEWQYATVNGSSCNLVAQPGTVTETIEWQSLKVYEWQKEGQREKVWLEDIENGDAETPWGDLANVKYNDQENNFKVCAWSKERMVNLNDEGGWDPFPASIEVDPDNDANHVFVCHGKAAITEGDAAAWDNQFWIQSKHAWKAGTSLKIKFRYKASKEVTCQTQIHKQNPSDYLIWHAIGDMSFTETWQTFDKTITMGDDMNGGWSVAFNLNSSDKDAIDFYFDDLSWQYLLLDEGYFVSGINSKTTTSYDDLDNAIPFEETSEGLVAVVGEVGKPATHVDQVMISTTRGDDQAFMGATLKPTGKIHDNPEEWQEYVSSTNARLDLPGLGAWKIVLDVEYTAISFDMIDGVPYDEPDPVAIYTYADEIVVNGQERDDLKDSKGQDGTITVREEADDPAGVEVGGEGHNGEAWDNQFFIKANRALKKGEVTKLAFNYMCSVEEAKTTTQCHGENPGDYKHYAAIGDVTFTNDWQPFEQEFTVPEQADEMWNIAFNMAEIKEACEYHIKDVQWYIYDASLDAGLTTENLISGGANFYVKEGAGTTPRQWSTDGINNVVNKKATSNVTYNLAGQRVSKDFKGIVVKNGQKFMNK